MGGARRGGQVVAGRRRAPPITALPPLTSVIRKPLCARAKAHPAPTTHVSDADCRRPGGSNSAAPQISCPVHRSCSAQTKDPGSTASRAPWVRAPSMRPRESEGKAEGLDEDDDGGGPPRQVRSEGSGPQSWAIVPTVTAASGDLRRWYATDEDPPYRVTDEDGTRPTKNHPSTA